MVSLKDFCGLPIKNGILNRVWILTHNNDCHSFDLFSSYQNTIFDNFVLALELELYCTSMVLLKVFANKIKPWSFYKENGLSVYHQCCLQNHTASYFKALAILNQNFEIFLITQKPYLKKQLFCVLFFTSSPASPGSPLEPSGPGGPSGPGSPVRPTGPSLPLNAI